MLDDCGIRGIIAHIYNKYLTFEIYKRMGPMTLIRCS